MKNNKKKKPTKPKIDIVLESLLNLETQMRELIKRIDNLEQKKINDNVKSCSWVKSPIVWW